MPKENKKCNCFDARNEKLEEMDLKISSACMVFSLQPGKIGLQYCLPLTKLDGKKPKRGTASQITISHCPFCGSEL